MINKIYKDTILIVACLLLSSSFNQVFATETFGLSFYHSVHHNNSLQDIVNEDFSEMPSSNSFGIENGTYWFRLNIDTSEFTNNVVAYIPTHNIDSIEVYTLTNNNKLQFVSKTGNLVAKEDLALNYRYPAFRIGQKDLVKTYFIKVKFPKGANFPLKIISEEDFNEKDTFDLIYLSFFYGISLVVLLLHLFYFFKFRNPYYLFYFGFLFTLIFNLLLWDGTLSHILRPFKNQGIIELVFHVIEEIFLLAFSIHFLGFKKRMPNFIRIAYSCPILLAIAYFTFSITGNFKIVAIADAIGISTMVILWSIGVYYWKKNSYAKFYVISYLILMPLGMYYFIGYGFGWWPVTGEDVIVKIGSTVDMLIFTYAIIFRMKVKENLGIKKILELEIEVAIIKSEIKNQDPYFIFLKENDLSETPLTLKEIEVLKSIYEGLSNPQIAEKLFISLSTVKSHISNIFQKFGINNRLDLKSLIAIKINN
jgi:DNA-binding CsgD family transcriptional regulator